MDRRAVLAQPELRQNPITYHRQVGPRFCRVPQLAAQFGEEFSRLAEESIQPAVLFGHPRRNEVRRETFPAWLGIGTLRFVCFRCAEELTPAQFLQVEHGNLLYEPGLHSKLGSSSGLPMRQAGRVRAKRNERKRPGETDRAKPARQKIVPPS